MITDFGQILITSPVVVVVNQVGFLEEGAEASLLELLPPLEDIGELLLPCVKLDLELTEGKRLAGAQVRFEEGSDDLELPGLNIDFEDINVIVTCAEDHR